MLLAPSEAVVHFGQPRPAGASNEDWIKHQFALRAVIAEICCGALQTTLLETLKPLTASMEIPPATKKAKKQKKKKQQPKTKQSEQPQQQQSGQTQGPHSAQQQQQQLHPQHDPEQGAEAKTQHSRRNRRSRIKTHNRKGQDATASANTVEPLSVNESTRWKPRSMFLNAKDADVKAAEPDELRDARLLRLLLNKLTPSNLDKLVSVFVSETTVHLSNDRMRDAVVTIVSRASLDRRFAPVHAELCGRLVKDLPAPAPLPPSADNVLTFREALGQFCLDDLNVVGIQTPAEGGSDLLQIMQRQRYIGSNRFIGELCNQGVFSVEYVLPLLNSRLQQTQFLSTDTTAKANETNEAPLEALCVILETCGERIEQQATPPSSQVVWDRCWATLNDLVGEEERHHSLLRLSFRMKSLILDLLELRSLQWRPTRFGARERKAMVAKPLVERDHGVHSSTATKRRRGKKGSRVKFIVPPSNSQD